jgi:23S rRNA (guanosine2251-2'-O)-methyltransferase
MLKKFLRKEHGDDSSALSLAMGVHAIEEAFQAQKPIEKILVSKNKTQPGITSILKKARQLGVPVQFVPTEKLQRYTKGNHQGIIAIISPVHYHSLQQVIDFTYQHGEAPLLLMLEGITDVRNFGAIARTAWASGAHALIIPSAENALINETSIQTSAGALMHIPVCREKSSVNVLMLLKEQGIQIVAADAKGDRMLVEMNLKIPTLIIMGSEGFGLSGRIEALCDSKMRIPMKHSFDSYNVSVAVGMILYESLRQRMGEERTTLSI